VIERENLIKDGQLHFSTKINVKTHPYSYSS